MAVFNTMRLRDILVRGGVADDPVATDFIEELNAQAEEAFSAYATNEHVGLGFERVLRAIAEADARRAEMEARLAELAAQQARHINQAVGIVLAGIALAVGLLLGLR
jgi:predicted sugar kinase